MESFRIYENLEDTFGVAFLPIYVIATKIDTVYFTYCLGIK